MFTYQAYLAKDNGEISCSPEVFLASDDAAAIEQVRRPRSMCRVMAGLPPREAMGVSSRTEVPLKLSARRDMAATLLGFRCAGRYILGWVDRAGLSRHSGLKDQSRRPVPDGASADCASVP